MKFKYQQHQLVVERWLATAGKKLSAEQQIDLLEQTIGALWRAAQPSISEVTLALILDRVVINTRDHFPNFPDLAVAAPSLDVAPLRARRAVLGAAKVKAAVAFLITEFVAINSGMTADALTPAMHKTLSKIRWKKRPKE